MSAATVQQLTRLVSGPPPVLTLSSRQDLISARDRHAGLRHRPVVLDLPELPPGERDTSSQRLTELLDECGCDTGARAMVAGAVITGLGLAALTGPSLGLLALSPLVVVGAVIGAGSGKAYGLARSRRQFRREIDRLLSGV